MNTKRIIRLEPHGPTDSGMPKMRLSPGDFQSELPVQHKHIYYEDDALGLEVGVWDTTSMQEVFGPYPGDEFMWVLEGKVIMVRRDPRGDSDQSGSNFLHPKRHTHQLEAGRVPAQVLHDLCEPGRTNTGYLIR